jgi:hypothetical protein
MVRAGEGRTERSTNMTRLDTIATAQKKTRTRDVMFACFVALAAIVTVTTVGNAVGNAAPHISQR